MSASQSRPGSAWVLLSVGGAVAALSSSSIFIKELEALGLPLLMTAGARMGLAAAVVAPAAVWQAARGSRRPGRRAARDHGTPLRLTSLAGLLLAVHFGAWTLSLGLIPIARSVLLVSTHPLLTALGEALFLGRRLRPREVAGAVLGIAGIFVIVLGGGAGVAAAGGTAAGGTAAGGTATSGTAAGDALALVGAASITGYFLLGRRLRENVRLLQYVAPLYAVAAVALLAVAAANGAWRLPDSLAMWGLLAGLVLLPTLLGHAVMSWAIRHLPATAISSAFLGEAVGASVLAWLFFGQIPASATWAGGLVTLAGIRIVFARERPPESQYRR